MKKMTFFLILFCFCNLWAQPNEDSLVARFGAIRADMVRDVCKIVGYDNDSVLKTISNGSLKEFQKRIAQHDTLNKVISVAQPLFGLDVSEYERRILDTRRKFRDQLVAFFPDKETEIENVFYKYVQIIENSTPQNDETVAPATQHYITGASSSKKENNQKNQKSGILSKLINFMKIVVICGVLIMGVLLLFKKWRKRPRRKMQSPPPIPQNESFNALESPKESGSEEVKSEKPKNEVPKGEDPEEEPKGEEPKRKPFDPKGKSMALDAGEWIIIGASVQGNGHISMDVPCQDNHAYEYLGEGWGIAITSDGAGSAKLSHLGSAAIVSRAMVHFKELIEKEDWIKNQTLPTEIEWMKKSFKILKKVRDELELLSNKKSCDIKDLSATIIVVIHSPMGLLVVHIGDGRAGYRSLDGEWHSMITPHKGEEANQTIFIPSNFWNIQFYEMSGVMVPESKIIKEQITAFTLMSDGCENTSWLCNQFNESTGKYYDPNVPHKKFFDSLLETLQSFRKNNVPLNEREEKWFEFIKEGNKSFVKETDDKTMILGALYL